MTRPTRKELEAELDRHRDALAAESDWRRNRVYEETYEWRDAAEDFAAEVDRLQHWKDESLIVLAQWDEVWVALGSPGGLGASKASASLSEINHRKKEQS